MVTVVKLKQYVETLYASLNLRLLPIKTNNIYTLYIIHNYAHWHNYILYVLMYVCVIQIFVYIHT